jgi:predicted 3-demethylubiquinone-9 3-methyltransferase (glyoxalase superfamily)
MNENSQQKITPFLWFKNETGEAMDFYLSVFKNSKIINQMKMPDGSVFSGTMIIEGQTIHFLNTRNETKFLDSFSLMISCQTQDEVDEYWNKLTANGGKESKCGWCIDKFGISWQIIPTALGKFIGNADREAANRAIQAMFGMNKIIIADLEKAFNGE